MPEETNAPVFLSAVLPVFNEEENLPALHERLTQVLQGLGKSYEIIFVDDGSRDRSFEIMKELSEKDPHVRALSLSRNFGHQICLTAGLDHARGEVVAMMDADLQDPPELLHEMLKKYEEGYDIVYAVRTRREGETFFKLATAAIFYRLLRFCTRIEIPVDTGDFRIISRRALDSMLSLRERSRFLRGLFSWVGFRQIGVSYVRPPRYKGETKYPFRKMLKFALDGITAFSTFPLHLATYLGFFSASLGALYGLVVLWKALFLGIQGPGGAATLVTVLFFGGVQLLTLGILGEYIGRIFEEVKNRPLYFVRTYVGFDEEPDASRAGARPKTPRSGGAAS